LIQKYTEDYGVSIPPYIFDSGRGLLDPSGGDVVFVVRDKGLSRQKLFASKEILAAKSEYFACSMTISSIYTDR
jgi:hypothetical protein